MFCGWSFGILGINVVRWEEVERFEVFAGGLFGVTVGEEPGSYNSQRSVKYKLKKISKDVSIKIDFLFSLSWCV